MWMAFFFGGLAQFIAGFQEFKTGNNFGFAAFTTYGAFWIALGGIFLTANLRLLLIANSDIGWFLVIFSILTAIYLIGAMRQNSALSVVFLTLLIGYILLDILFPRRPHRMAHSCWNRTDYLRFLGFIFNGARGFNPSGYKSSDWQGLDEVSILTGMPADPK